MKNEEDGACFPFAHSQDESDDKATHQPTSAEAEDAFLRALKEALSNFPHEKKSELVHVQQVAPDLVDDDHLLLFLRGKGVDVEQALQTIVEHWRQRYNIFGSEKYALPMTLNGAMKDNINNLRQGYLTILPTCDGAGRSIIYVNKSTTNKSNPTADEKIQMLWYLLHILMSNPDAQKSGFITLANARGGSPNGYDPMVAYRSSFLHRSFPIQKGMIHLCYANATFPLIAQGIAAVIKSCQNSFLLHNGSEERVLESLSEHHLPKQCVPTDIGGTLTVSTDLFVRNRVVIEGGALKPNEDIATFFSSSHSDENGSKPAISDEVLRGANPSDTDCWSALAATSHTPPSLENNQSGTKAQVAVLDSSVLFPFPHPQDENRNTMADQAISPEVEAAIEAAPLRTLKEKLYDMPHDEKSALAHVQQVAPALVDDDHFLIFLRAEGFDVDFALKRLVQFWTQRYEVFGLEKYALPMTLNGAMQDTIEILKKGYMTILPTCDDAGRPVIFIDKSTLKSYPTVDEKLQIFWYLLHILMHNPEAQKRGFVILANSGGSSVQSWNPRWSSQSSLIARAFPIAKCDQPTFVHVCNHCNSVFRLFGNAIKAVMSQSQRDSFLLHNGLAERVLESLSTYDLPKHCVPTSIGGTLHVPGDAFVKDRQVIEGGALELIGNIATSLSSSHTDNSRSKPKTDDDAVEGLSSNSSAAEFWAASTAINHIEPRLENYQTSTEAQKPVPPHSSFLFPHRQATHSATPSEVKSTVKATDEATSLRELKENDKMGTLSVPYNNESIESEHLSVESNAPSNMPTPPTGKKDTTDYFPPEKSAHKQEHGTNAGNKNEKSERSEKKTAQTSRNKTGASGDPRMNLAVQAMIDNPNLSLVAALMRGGFVFNDLADSPGVSISNVRDTDNITLYQRRNQLMRRLRYKRRKISPADSPKDE